MAAGESLTQKIVVSGSGNLNLMGDLPLDELDGFKVYRDQPQVEISALGRTASAAPRRSAARWCRLRAGAARVPETRLVYFDPSQRDATVTATGAGGGARRRAQRRRRGSESHRVVVGGRRQGRGAHPRQRSAAGSRRGGAGRGPGAGGDAPAAAGASADRVRRSADGAAARRSVSRPTSGCGGAAARCARALGAIGQRGELESRDASSVLRRYIGDRVGAEGQALTPRECAERLSARGASEALVGEVRALLERFEAADFGGGGAGAGAGGRAARRDRTARARAAERALMRLRLRSSASVSSADLEDRR